MLAGCVHLSLTLSVPCSLWVCLLPAGSLESLTPQVQSLPFAVPSSHGSLKSLLAPSTRFFQGLGRWEGRGLSETGRGLNDVRSRGKECRSGSQGLDFQPHPIPYTTASLGDPGVPPPAPPPPRPSDPGPRPLLPQTRGSRLGAGGVALGKTDSTPRPRNLWRERQDTNSTLSVSAVKMRSQGYRGRGVS